MVNLLRARTLACVAARIMATLLMVTRIMVTLLVVMLSACVAGDEPLAEEDAETSSEILVADAEAVSLAATADGGLLWADRRLGTVRDLAGQLVASVDVNSEGQRGLLGLAVLGNRVFLAWTDPETVLTVGEVVDDRVVPVWIGPETANGANGGRLVASPDGLLVIGIGTLLNSKLVDDPGSLNGKLLAIDPDGPPTQEPEVVSSGWNNPFAFDFATDGALWVADNHPLDGEERLARGDSADGADNPAAILPKDSAPSGLVALDRGALLVCSFTTGAVIRYEVNDEVLTEADPEADNCRFDITQLTDGRVVYSTAGDIRVLSGS